MKIEKDNILAISADPYGLGLDYWKKEEYYELSRMTNLVNKIEDYTKIYKKTLILNVGNSVLADCSNQLENDLSKYITTKNNMIEIENKDLNYSNEKFSQFNRDVLNSYSNVKKKIDEERKKYINELSNITSPKEFNTFFELHIGDDFYLLIEKMIEIVKEEIEHLLNVQQSVVLDINKTTKAYEDKKNKILELSGSLGGKFSKSIKFIPVDKLRNGIKIFSDTTKLPIKFKSWGIVNLSKRLKFGGAFIGTGIEAFETYDATNKKAKFDSFINERIKELSSFFKEINSLLTYEKYESDYFPTIAEFKKNKEQKEEFISNQEEEIEILQNIYSELISFRKTLN